MLAWCVASLAMAESTWLPLPAIVPSALVFAALVGAATRVVASGKRPNRPGIAGRVAVAASVGVVVGELAALVMFSGAIDRHLDEQALRNADSAPVVAQAAAALRQTQHARNGLDNAVELARESGQGPGNRALRVPSFPRLSADPDHRRSRARTRNANGKRASRRRAARAGRRAW